MADKMIYLVIGIGVDEATSVGDKGTFCPTWPDCERGPSGSGGEEPSVFDETGHVSVKGTNQYSAVGGRVFDEEYAARGWLEYSEAGKRFKQSFLNVIIVRSAV